MGRDNDRRRLVVPGAVELARWVCGVDERGRQCRADVAAVWVQQRHRHLYVRRPATSRGDLRAMTWHDVDLDDPESALDAPTPWCPRHGHLQVLDFADVLSVNDKQEPIAVHP